MNEQDRAAAIEAAANDVLAIWKTKEACNALRALDKALAQPADAVTCAMGITKQERRETFGTLVTLLGLDAWADDAEEGLADYDDLYAMMVIAVKELRADRDQLRSENERLRDAVQDVLCDPGVTSLGIATVAKCQVVRGTAVEPRYVVVRRDEWLAANSELAAAIERAEKAEQLLAECGKAWHEWDGTVRALSPESSYWNLCEAMGKLPRPGKES